MRILRIFLVLLLAACSNPSQPVQNSTNESKQGSSFGVKIGTSNAASLSVAVLAEFDLKTAGSVELKLVSPTGTSAIFETQYATAGKKTTWFIPRDESGAVLPPDAGDYTFSMTFNSRISSKTVTFDPNRTIPIPTGIKVDGSSNLVTTSWDAVPGAKSYLIDIYSPSNGMERGLIYAYTGEISYTFEDYYLEADTNYFFSVTALTADYGNGPPALSSVDTFEVSYSSTSFEPR